MKTLDEYQELLQNTALCKFNKNKDHLYREDLEALLQEYARLLKEKGE